MVISYFLYLKKITSLFAGGPSSSCEMIILRNNSHGGIIRVCMGIFTTALPRTTDAKPQFASKNSGLEVSNSPRPHQP